eukprot:365817-Chlamydomonas_euryale.AAC.5
MVWPSHPPGGCGFAYSHAHTGWPEGTGCVDMPTRQPCPADLSALQRAATCTSRLGLGLDAFAVACPSCRASFAPRLSPEGVQGRRSTGQPRGGPGRGDDMLRTAMAAPRCEALGSTGSASSLRCHGAVASFSRAYRRPLYLSQRLRRGGQARLVLRSAGPPVTAGVAATEAMVEAALAERAAVRDGGAAPLILFFTASWCGPCKMASKELNKLLMAHKVWARWQGGEPGGGRRCMNTRVA